MYDSLKSQSRVQNPVGLLQSFPIPEWKWENVTIDFLVGLPRSLKSNDSIWIVVDRLNKSTHFIPIRTTDPARHGELYVNEIVRLHGLSVSFVSDSDTYFMYKFWEGL